MADENAADDGQHIARTTQQLAAERTTMAAERALMAWIRTSMTMMALGIAVYRFFIALAAEGQPRRNLASGLPNSWDGVDRLGPDIGGSGDWSNSAARPPS